MQTSRALALLGSAALLLFSACKDDPTGPDNFAISLSALNLQQLPAGQGHYELWISFPEDAAQRALGKPTHGDQAFVSFGKFNLSVDNAQLRNLSGQAMSFAPAEKVNINLAVDALITIEPEGDHDNTPGTRLLGGEFTGSDKQANAFLSTAAADAFNFDYRTSTAAYVLTTPTTNDSTDFSNGLWWVTRSGATLAAGLGKLPTLADTSGWRYEGWIIDRTTGAAYSTGKFLAAAAADFDRAGATAGTEGGDANGDGRGDGFAFPGQDFIREVNNIPARLVLDGGNFETRITLEPEPDYASTPSYFLLFSDDIIGPSLPRAHTPQSMNNRATGLPAATVSIQR